MKRCWNRTISWDNNWKRYRLRSRSWWYSSRAWQSFCSLLQRVLLIPLRVIGWRGSLVRWVKDLQQDNNSNSNNSNNNNNNNKPMWSTHNNNKSYNNNNNKNTSKNKTNKNTSSSFNKTPTSNRTLNTTRKRTSNWSKQLVSINTSGETYKKYFKKIRNKLFLMMAL